MMFTEALWSSKRNFPFCIAATVPLAESTVPSKQPSSFLISSASSKTTCASQHLSLMIKNARFADTTRTVCNHPRISTTSPTCFERSAERIIFLYILLMKKIKRPKNIKNKSFFKRENKKIYFFVGWMLVCIPLKDQIPFDLFGLWGEGRMTILQWRSIYIKTLLWIWILKRRDRCLPILTFFIFIVIDWCILAINN